MAFLSPLWLLALLPWAALAAWLLRGRRPRVKVPFLQLWRGPLPLEIPKRGWRAPPIWLAFAVLAVLAAIFGASRPVVGHDGSGPPICMIIDCGMSMSATEQGVPRFVATTRRMVDRLPTAIPLQTPVELITIPGANRQTTLRELPDIVTTIPVSATDSRAVLIASVQNQLASNTGPILVISDQSLGIANDRLIQVYPSRSPDDVAIVHLAASESPHPQVMVRIRNDSSRTTAPIRIASGNFKVEQNLDLPPKGQESDFFIDMNELGAQVLAELTTADDQPANDRRWLVREGSNPRIEIRAPISPSLRRMVEVYAKSRPTDAASQPLAIVGRVEDLPANLPGVVVAADVSLQPARGTILAANHPITQNVSWPSINSELKISLDGPQGWTAVVNSDGKPMVAVQDGAVRRVWVGFDAANWPATTDFVIFWANILKWCAPASPHFADHPLSDWREDWKPMDRPAITPPPADGRWPGIYRSPDGADHALNAPDVRASSAPDADWKSRLIAARDTTHGGKPIAPALILLAVALIAAAAFSLGSTRDLRKIRQPASTI